MNKKFIFICIILLIVLLFIFFFTFKPKLNGNVFLTGQAIEDSKILQEYTYTKAICNKTNFCQDYEIKCRDKTLISSSPITGAVIQHNSDWKDPRENKELCE